MPRVGDFLNAPEQVADIFQSDNVRRRALADEQVRNADTAIQRGRQRDAILQSGNQDPEALAAKLRGAGFIDDASKLDSAITRQRGDQQTELQKAYLRISAQGGADDVIAREMGRLPFIKQDHIGSMIEDVRARRARGENPQEMFYSLGDPAGYAKHKQKLEADAANAASRLEQERERIRDRDERRKYEKTRDDMLEAGRNERARLDREERKNRPPSGAGAKSIKTPANREEMDLAFADTTSRMAKIVRKMMDDAYMPDSTKDAAHNTAVWVGNTGPGRLAGRMAGSKRTDYMNELEGMVSTLLFNVKNASDIPAGMMNSARELDNVLKSFNNVGETGQSSLSKLDQITRNVTGYGVLDEDDYTKRGVSRVGKSGQGSAKISGRVEIKPPTKPPADDMEGFFK